MPKPESRSVGHCHGNSKWELKGASKIVQAVKSSMLQLKKNKNKKAQ